MPSECAHRSARAECNGGGKAAMRQGEDGQSEKSLGFFLVIIYIITWNTSAAWHCRQVIWKVPSTQQTPEFLVQNSVG